MTKIEEIKRIRKQYGLSLKDAFNMANGKTNQLGLIQLSAIGRQNKLTVIYHEHCYPWQDCIVKAPYGQHIDIVCDKCGATGTTKNIDYIGARTLFIKCICKNNSSIRPVLPVINNFENLTNNVV